MTQFISNEDDTTIVEAEQCTAPCILTTMFGECAAQSGDWIIKTEERPTVVRDEVFQQLYRSL